MQAFWQQKICRTFHEFPLDGLSREAALTAVAILLFIGAMGKSAMPLHTWLPDAMEEPTPVCLIHAATMVTAGVFLVARMSVFENSTDALNFVVIIGACTAFFAATVGLVKTMLNVIAYSMFSARLYVLALGVGA